MFRFANESVFMGVIFVLLLVLIFLFENQRLSKKLKRVFDLKMFPFFTGQFSKTKKFVKFFLSISALVFMIVALARPQWGKRKNSIKSEGIELMVAIDVSKSMLSEDVRPSRLEQAKKEVSRLLDLLGGDKVGLVAFAGSSILLSPLTTDKSALKMFLESLSTESVENQGTVISKVLMSAGRAFKRGGEQSDPDKRITRAVLLISDGEDHEPGALKVAKELEKEGIRIFTMAFGSEKGGKIPVRSSHGLLKDYVKDRSGKMVITKVNDEILRQLARIGRGSFYHVSFGGQQMEKLWEDLQKLEKSEFGSLSMEDFDEKFQIPLFFAFLFGFIELFIGYRRKQSDQWRGRFV